MKNQEITQLNVTPEMAKRILEGGANKRPFNQKKMLSYSEDMTAKRWKGGTYELIKIASNGVVIDGVHRLRAVIHSGVSVPLQIVTGFDEGLFDVLDTGKSRDGADVLAIIGVKSSNQVVSVIRRHYSLIKRQKNPRFKVLKNREIIEIYQYRPEFWDEITLKGVYVCRNFSRLLTVKSAGSIIAYISDRYSKEIAYEFFEDLVNGNNFRSQIIGVLTKKLINSKVSKINRMSDHIIDAYVLKAFKMWLIGQTGMRLKFNPEIEEYPFL